MHSLQAASEEQSTDRSRLNNQTPTQIPRVYSLRTLALDVPGRLPRSVEMAGRTLRSDGCLVSIFVKAYTLDHMLQHAQVCIARALGFSGHAWVPTRLPTAFRVKGPAKMAAA